MDKCEECDMRCAYIVGLPGDAGACYMAEHFGMLDKCPRYKPFQEMISKMGRPIRFVRHIKRHD